MKPSVEINRLALPAGMLTLSVVRARATFTMTPRMFVSRIAQYNAGSRSVGSNLRLRWEYLPGSELFASTDEYDSAAAHDLQALRNRGWW